MWEPERGEVCWGRWIVGFGGMRRGFGGRVVVFRYSLSEMLIVSINKF